METDSAPEDRSPQPVLSICTPAFDRPSLIRRTLLSAISGNSDLASDVEIVVSDDSTDPDVKVAVGEAGKGWPGTLRYVHNEPRLGLVNNFNQCVELAAGRFVLLVHDDDFLLPSGLRTILAAIARSGERDRVLLFGVHVVDERGGVIRRQAATSERYVAPAEAMQRLLTESSFVRFPALVVRRDAYDEVGPFDPLIGNPTDFDMWTRLFGRFGFRWIPASVSAYTVHEEALTTGMFTSATVRTLLQIFESVSAMNLLSPMLIRRCRADWFHQFILAGAFRRLRVGDRQGAAAVYRLFDLPEVKAVGRSARWLPFRAVLYALIRLPGGLAARLVRMVSIGLSRTNRLPLVGQ